MRAQGAPRGKAWRGGGFLESRSGVTALEFALLAPILCLLIFGGIEFGRLLWTESALNFSVEEAARCGAINPDEDCATSSAVQSFAADVTPQLGFPAAAFTPDATASCGYKVNATYSYRFIVSGLIPMSPTLTAQACFANQPQSQA